MHKNKNCPNAKFSEISVYGKLEIIRFGLGHMFPFPLKGEHKEGENSGSERQTETG